MISDGTIIVCFVALVTSTKQSCGQCVVSKVTTRTLGKIVWNCRYRRSCLRWHWLQWHSIEPFGYSDTFLVSQFPIPIVRFGCLQWHSISHSLTVTLFGGSRGCHSNRVLLYWCSKPRNSSGCVSPSLSWGQFIEGERVKWVSEWHKEKGRNSSARVSSFATILLSSSLSSSLSLPSCLSITWPKVPDILNRTRNLFKPIYPQTS